MRQRGFSLVELLSSTAIIAVLMAVMFPLFVKVRNRMYAYSAASNVRQLGLSATIYRTDYDGYFPNPQWAAKGDPQDINADGTVEWYEKLLPYADNNRSILRVHADNTDPHLRPCSFADNSWFDYPCPESMIVDQADTIYLTERKQEFQHDFIEWWHWQEGTWPPDPDHIPYEKASQQAAIFRYEGLNNYLYIDGHSKMRRFEDTWYPRVTWWPEAPTEAPSGPRY